MNAAEKSLTILGAWLAFAVLAGPLLWSLFLRDRREVGADEAFDTLPDWARPGSGQRTRTPIGDAAFDAVYGARYAAWQREVQACADDELAEMTKEDS